MAASESGHDATRSKLARPSAAGPLSAVQLASVIAEAVCGVRGVAALSAGRDGTVATYGPGQTLRGVAVRHGQDGTYTVEVHVVVNSAELVAVYGDPSDERKKAGAETPAMLATFAEAIRGRLGGELRERGAPSPAAVDVYFDDWE